MEAKTHRLIATPGVAGVDEAGRGPLAGPVTVAAVVLPAKARLPGLDDSKKLTAAKREELEARIRDCGCFAIVDIGLEEIEEHNILRATLLGMGRALAALRPQPEEALIDGTFAPDGHLRMTTVIDGDAKYRSIAAASILAKTHRDRLMKSLAEEYPVYGFEKHFGYATKHHIAALEEHGPCPIHRRSFGTVAMLDQLCLDFES
ncbi:MAG: ribonuclease HII [Armatimonadetes bacterium]|nr:ribonuclease HII [Armatimonadota bacterium]